MGKGRPFGWRVPWPLVRFAVGLVLAGVVLYELNGQRNHLVNAIDQLGRLRLVWVAVGAAFELCSYFGLAAIQRRLLGAGGVRIGMGFGTAVSFATSAIITSLPGGAAFAAIYLFRQYRKRGADRVISVWALVCTFAFEALVLSILTCAGVALAIDEGASYNLIGVTVIALVVFGAVDAIVWQRRWLIHVITWLLAWTRRRFRRPRRPVVEVTEALTDHLAAVRLGRSDYLRTLLAASILWTCDCSALAASFLAVGVPVPWRGLLLAYGASQLVSNLPITPGGLGVVEGSLTAALVAFGSRPGTSVSTVLLFRIINFWSPLVIGWLCWAGIAIVERYQGREEPPAAIPPTEQEAADRAV